ncbi:MAG TPA: protein kinase [Tepidisphaeraceae bacterium]
MSSDSRVSQVLEDVLESGCSPERACEDCPELLPEVLRRLRALRKVEAQLNNLFPPADGTDNNGPSEFLSLDGGLPSIPGYVVESVLGRGGMGVVYKACQLKLNRPVAIKMLLGGVYASPSERIRFMHEAEAAARLSHAHIVQIYDIGDLEGRPYLMMEFVGGGTLADRIAGVPKPARDAAALVATLAETMHVAHRHGIVHRDLKPSNILLTDEGDAKISDFGLARWFNSDANLTLTGAWVGTPSSMAPEQARGTTSAIGPGTDVYALGAILYEMLTGRPPFRGESASDTERQVIADEPVPPSRLNPRVPRDLETICLECLQKDPARRFNSAAALAEDLHRFLRGEPITAHRAGVIERGVRWVRRHPTLSVALAGALLLAGLLVSGGVWLALQRADRAHAVEADLKEVAAFQQQSRWAAAQTALERAEARLGMIGPRSLRRQFDLARRDLDLVMRLDAIRLRRVTQGAPAIYRAQANQRYEQAVRDAGLGTVAEPPDRVARKINDSAVKPALLTALDDWMVCAPAGTQRGWLVAISQKLDPDPNGWRARIVAPATWDNLSALSTLASEVPGDGPSVSLLLALGDRLNAAGGDPAPLLRRVEREHPADFWANLMLGDALLFSDPVAAGGFYRTALAARPQAAVAYCSVGDALRRQNELDDAIHYYRAAIQQDPRYARGYTVLGMALSNQGMLDEAIENYRKAIPLDPDYTWSYFELGNALRTEGLFEEASDNFHKALLLEPTNTRARDGAECAAIREGRAEEVWARWRKAVDAAPGDVDNWIGYGELSLYLGHDDEYRRVRHELLGRFGSSTDPSIAERTSRACLLLPCEGDELRQAAILADRAAAAEHSTAPWIYQYFLFAKGLADYRQGRLDEAVAIMEGGASKVMGPCPALIDAMVKYQTGDVQTALKLLAGAAVGTDWSARAADKRDVWIWHALRREAENLILPNLNGLMAGTEQPHSDDERLAMAAICQFRSQSLRAAQLYLDVLTSAPEAADAYPDLRFRAACAAALTAAGRGGDATRLDTNERARWRQHARDWLSAEVEACSQQLDRADPTARTHLAQRLLRLRYEPGLAGIREAEMLRALPAREQTDSVQIWKAAEAALNRNYHAK